MNTFLSLISVVIGNFLYALTVKLFLLPARLVTGGTTGIALTVNHLTGENILAAHISPIFRHIPIPTPPSLACGSCFLKPFVIQISASWTLPPVRTVLEGMCWNYWTS